MGGTEVVGFGVEFDEVGCEEGVGFESACEDSGVNLRCRLRYVAGLEDFADGEE